MNFEKIRVVVTPAFFAAINEFSKLSEQLSSRHNVLFSASGHAYFTLYRVCLHSREREAVTRTCLILECDVVRIFYVHAYRCPFHFRDSFTFATVKKDYVHVTVSLSRRFPLTHGIYKKQRWHLHYQDEATRLVTAYLRTSVGMAVRTVGVSFADRR